MAEITAAEMIAFTDKLVAFYILGIGVASGNYGMGILGGSFGASKRAQDLEDLLMDTQDADKIAYLGAAFRAMRNASDGRVALAALSTGSLRALDFISEATGTANDLAEIVDLNTFATYYNLTAVTKWGCLFAPDFYDLYYRAFGLELAAHNTYFELMQGAANPNGLAKFVVGAGLTLGSSIDSTKYAGSTGRLELASITSTGSDVVTVSGTFRKTDGTTATGDATATISSASPQNVTLTPPFTSALLLSVSNVTVGANITGGTIYVETVRPAGRSNPPV